MKDLGFSGLQTQDSLGITRARLAKQRLNENLTLLNQIKDMQARHNSPSLPFYPLSVEAWEWGALCAHMTLEHQSLQRCF